MVVNVNYITTIREITKKQGENIELEEHGTLQDLLEKLIAKYGPEFREVIFPSGRDKVGIYLGISTGGGGFCAIDSLDINLSHGDSVLIGSMIAGG